MTASISPSALLDSRTTETNSVREWIALNYPNLDVESLSAILFANAQRELERLEEKKGEALSADPTTEALEKTLQGALFLSPFAEESVIAAVKETFHALSQTAWESGLNGQMCRAFLGLLLTADGYPVIEELRPWVKERSCDIFLKMAGAGQFIDQISRHIFAALATTLTMESGLRQKLLQVFDCITASADRPSRQSLARTLKDALSIELGRPPADIDEGVAVAILDRVLQFPDPEINPILEALASMEGLRATRKHAKFVIDELHGSAIKIWTDTCADLVSTVEERTRMLASISSRDLSDTESAQVIAYVFKENPLDSENDPRLEQLLEVLDSKGFLTRLTASHAAILQAEKQNLPADAPAVVALMENTARVLSDIAMSAEDTVSGAQAIASLTRLEKISAPLQKIVGDAKLSASVRFIQRQQANP